LDDYLYKLRELSLEDLVAKAVTAMFLRDRKNNMLERENQELRGEIDKYKDMGDDPWKYIKMCRKANEKNLIKIEALESKLKKAVIFFKKIVNYHGDDECGFCSLLDIAKEAMLMLEGE
jgi:hypothetical protein